MATLEDILIQLLSSSQPRSREDIDLLAQQQAALSILPEQQAVTREQEAAQRAVTGGTQSIQGFMEALAPLLAQIGPATNQAYQQAAQTTGQLSQGFSDNLRRLLSDAAGQTNQYLSSLGSPQQVSPGGDAADVLYGLTGYIPGSTLAREGAAFTSAANRLPATAVGLGRQDIASLQHRGVEQQADFARQLSDLAQRYPLIQSQIRSTLEDENMRRAQAGFGAVMDIAGFSEGQRQFDTQAQQRQAELEEQIREYEQNARMARTQAGRDFWLNKKELAIRQFAANMSAKELGLRGAEFKHKAAFDWASLGLDQQQLALQQLNSDRDWQRAMKEYGLDKQNLSLRAAELDLRYRNKGFTPQEIRSMNAEAATIAKNAFYGTSAYDKDQKTTVAYPPISYQQAIQEMFASGIPLARALPALNRFYKKGRRGRPVISIYQRMSLQKFLAKGIRR